MEAMGVSATGAAVLVPALPFFGSVHINGLHGSYCAVAHVLFWANKQPWLVSALVGECVIQVCAFLLQHTWAVLTVYLGTLWRHDRNHQVVCCSVSYSTNYVLLKHQFLQRGKLVVHCSNLVCLNWSPTA